MECLELANQVLEKGAVFAVLILVLWGTWKALMVLARYLKDNVVEPVVKTHVSAVEKLGDSYKQLAESNRITAEALGGQTALLKEHGGMLKDIHQKVTGDGQ